VAGVFALLDGRFDDAVRLGALFYAMASESPMFVYWYAVILAYSGRTAMCLDVVSSLPADPGKDINARIALLVGRAASGDLAGLDALMTPSLEAAARRDGQAAWNVAACYARLGDDARALGWLENAIARNFVPVAFLETIDPFLAPLRGDPRFEALMEKAREKQRAFEVEP